MARPALCSIPNHLMEVFCELIFYGPASVTMSEYWIIVAIHILMTKHSGFAKQLWSSDEQVASIF